MLENENMIDFLGSLKEMSSEQLSQLIQEETAKEVPNDDLVLMALDILEDREKESPIELGSKGKAAWIKYQSKVRTRQKKTILIWKPFMQVASVLLVITLLFALLPTRANAETWWERLARWTDDFFSFFNSNESEFSESEYIFQTDNKGLQEVYEAVVELGVTEPVVPMWLPEEFVLVECKIETTPIKKYVVACLSDGNSDIVLRITSYSKGVPFEYHKDEEAVTTIERHGLKYVIVKNNENSLVAWSKDNIECIFSIDCREETLQEIIESIYRRRMNE